MLSREVIINPRSFIYEQQAQNQQAQAITAHSYQHKTTSFQKCPKCNIIYQQSEQKITCLCLCQNSTNNIQNSIQLTIDKNNLILQPRLVRIGGQALQKNNQSNFQNQNHFTNCSQVGAWTDSRGCAFVDEIICNEETKGNKGNQTQYKMRQSSNKDRRKADIDRITLSNCYAIHIILMLSTCIPKIPLIPKLFLTTTLLLTLYLPTTLMYTIFIILYLTFFCFYLLLSASLFRLQSIFDSIKVVTRNKPKLIRVLAIFLFFLALPVLFCGCLLVGVASRGMWGQLCGVLTQLGFCYGEAWVIRNLVFG